jgi:glycine/D-amino acid oxidase-like deaminating enzyme/bacterioferritin-associated ferredoxin
MRLSGRPAQGAFHFTFDGRPVPALPGDTIAAALAAEDVLALRRAESGERRGLWCGMGACWDCLVTVDGAPARACMEKARPDAAVESGPVAMPPPRPAIPEHERICDVLVVGGGPAGLSAASAAASCGAETVLLDERAGPGGQYFKQQGESHAHLLDTQHRRGDALRARAASAGVEVLTGALVWGGFAPDEIASLVDGTAVVFRPRRLILAPGAHERPVAVPGWTLPGVMTVGAVQGLVRSHRVAPGGRVVLAGNGPLLLQVACELLDGGADVVAVVEAAAEPWPGRAMLALGWASPFLAAAGLRHLRRLRRAGVPVLWGSMVLSCEGAGRFERLVVATPQGERRIAAEVCALNLGFVPETGLARALGAAHQMSSRWPGVIETVRDEAGRTSLPSVFVVGDGGAMGGAMSALAQGRLAGLEAARDLGLQAPSGTPARRALRRAREFQRALWTLYAAKLPSAEAIPDAVVVCRCENVSAGQVRAAIADGAHSLPAVKRATRAGMGRCQGRMCATTLFGMCDTGGEAGHAAPRAPLRPVPIAALMRPEQVPDTPIALPVVNRWVTSLPGRNPGDCDVLVIGGGIVGLAAALFLAREGRDVVVADRGEPGLAASTANAGSLHVQLLPYEFSEIDPGPLAETPALAQRSIALWRELGAAAGESLGIRTEGGLMLAKTEADLDLLRLKARFERAQGVETEIVGPNELATLAPALARDYAGAAFCPSEGQGDPLRGTLALAALAWRAGARPARGVAVLGLERGGPGWRVHTSAGAVRAGQVLNAAGPYAAGVAALAGETLPIKGIVQQVIATNPVAPVLRQLVAQMGLHLSLKQGDGGHLLIGGGWPGRLGADGATRLLRRSIQGNLWTAAQVMPVLAGLEVIRAWTGLAVYLDRGPVIGESQPGLFHAATSNGYTLGPIAGRLIADAMLGRDTPPTAFAPNRPIS